MKSLVKVLMVLALAAVICLPGMAGATVSTIGGGSVTGSWTQGFNESGVGLFDHIEAFITSGPPFEAPIFSSYSVAGWDCTYPNLNYAAGCGPAVDNLTFNIQFSGDYSTPFSFDFLAYTGGCFGTGVCVEADHAVWDGGWTITSFDGCNYDHSAVPLPPSVLLLGTGLLGLVGLGWRSKKASQSLTSKSS